MNFFNIDIKKIFFICFIILLPLLSLHLQSENADSAWVRGPISNVAASMQNLFTSFSQGVKETTSLYLNLVNIKKNNRELEQQINSLKAQLTILEELGTTNAQLNQLLEFKKNTKMRLLAAQVIARPLFEGYHTLRINRGTAQGLKAGMAAITTEGVVGYVFRPQTNTSEILLITDHYAVVDGIVQRTRARGIIEGETKNTCRLLYLENAEDVSVDDMVVSSGLDDILPKGFPVGQVTSIERSPNGLNQIVRLKPVIASNRIDYLFIVVQAANEEFTFSNNVTPEAEPKEAKFQ